MILLLCSCSTDDVDKPAAAEDSINSTDVDWTNPIVKQRADPWVYLHDDGYYYLTATVPEWDRIELRRAKTIAGLATAPVSVIWKADTTGSMGGKIWAPEIHRVNDAWYIYFAAASAPESWDVRMYVLENKSANPLEGEWVEKGKITTNFDSFSLDATTFEHLGKSYLVWAQQNEKHEGNSDLWIAELENPWTIKGTQVRLSTPEQDWELIKYRVNEGPAVLKRNGKIFIAYSANATDHTYSIGTLTAESASNLLDPESWTKSSSAVFQSSGDAGQYGPGHNSFTRTADGRDVLIYHARPYKDVSHPLEDPNRHMRAQVFSWLSDGSPDFGTPIPDGEFKE